MEYFILKSKLINLLINKSKPNSITEMKNAYENFVINVLALNQPESDYGIQKDLFFIHSLARAIRIIFFKLFRCFKAELCCIFLSVFK